MTGFFYTSGDSPRLQSFLIRGQQYWRYDEEAARLDPGYPRALSLWEGAPPSPDDVTISNTGVGGPESPCLQTAVPELWIGHSVLALSRVSSDRGHTTPASGCVLRSAVLTGFLGMCSPLILHNWSTGHSDYSD